MYSIVLDRATKSYSSKRGSIEALKSTSLRINYGEFIVILGESGSGKSTLLQIMSGLDTPSTGRAAIDDRDIAKLRDKEQSILRNSLLGFVFQDFYLHPYLTLKQNIELPAVFAEVTLSEREKRTNELARYFSLENRLNHLPRELSGGQKQRAALIRAIYNSPKILFADEPTGNLDAKNAEKIFDYLKKINVDFGSTVILATHNELAAEYASRTLYIENGQIK